MLQHSRLLLAACEQNGLGITGDKMVPSIAESLGTDRTNDFVL